MQQRTLKTSVSCDNGIGVHSGARVKLCINPAKADTGIVFKRIDINDKDNIIKATFDNVVDTNFCTKIGNSGGVFVSTIEHLMAALYACGIDNAIIELDGEEVPIMDGSSIEFIKIIESGGITTLDKKKKILKITSPVIYMDKKNSIYAELIPTDKNSLDLDIKFDFRGRAKFQKQSIKTNIESFKEKIAPARTFGLKPEIEYLKSINLAKGGSLDNAIVVDGDQVLNKDGLRFNDEFVRHKTLDAIGDLYTSGYAIAGCFNGDNCGHGINNQLLRKLFSKDGEGCYEIL